MSRDGEMGGLGAAHLQMLGTSSNSRSFEIESWSYIQHKDYNLQVMQKVAGETGRRGIPATPAQRLAFYRTYATLPFKTHFLSLQYLDLNRFVWYYVFTLLFKSLPSCYIHLFLSSYAAEDHLFVPKMVPILYGYNLLVVVSGFLELSSLADVLARYIDFIALGVLHKSPWSRCDAWLTAGLPSQVVCAPLEQFRRLLAEENVTVASTGFGFWTNNNTFFQTSVALFNWRRATLGSEASVVYAAGRGHAPSALLGAALLVWAAAAAHTTALFHTRFWTVQGGVHWAVAGVLAAVSLHLLWLSLETTRDELLVRPPPRDPVAHAVRQTDFNLVAESISAPPFVHLLAARAAQQASPGGDSALQEFSNAAYFVFRGVLTFQLRAYCESLMRAPLQVSWHSPYPWFYLWPLYFGTFQFGDVMTVLFFILLFITEFLTFVGLYQCLVEVMWCEWPRVRRWLLSLGLVLAAGLAHVVVTSSNRYLVFVYTKGVVTLLEACGVVLGYPLGRLQEDLTFHYGTYPSRFRVWSFKLMPLYYAIKLYYLVWSLRATLAHTPLHHYMTRSDHVWWLAALPVLLGAAHALYAVLRRQRQNWRALFRPVARWGPRDHIQRQLRKQYQSYEYVNSQSSRYLSRYLMAKAEAETYKLDICYERAGRRSTVIHDAFRYDNEKKLV